MGPVAAVHPGMTAVDNTGQTLKPKQKELEAGRPPPGPTGETFIRARILLELPAAEASSLRTLEGGILVHKDVQRVPFEFPLTGPWEPQTHMGRTIAVTAVEPLEDGGYTVTARWEEAPRAPEQWGPDYYARPFGAYMSTAQGSQIGPRSTSSSSRVGNDRWVSNWTWGFQPSAERVPEEFVLEFLLRSEETETLHYKFEDIPLPTWEE